MVFVHGMYANGNWWRNVAPAFTGSHRCIVPELPFGGHRVPAAAGADLTAAGLARIVAGFLEALDLHEVTLVAGDLGGAVCQVVAAHHPDRLARLVLTPCDSYENFPPALLNYQCVAARLPAARTIVGLSARLARVRALRRLPVLYGHATKGPLDHELIDSYLEPLVTSAAIRRDAVKILRGVSNRYTLEAARHFAAFDRPVLLVWGREDRLFPFRYAERLARDFPDARLEPVDDAYTYLAEDQPARLVEAITEFVARAPTAAA
jgi:pimeloyl-ACP methyl ester carboxylesterase